MANETHIDPIDTIIDGPSQEPSASQRVTSAWGNIKARPSDRIFDPTGRGPKTISSWQIAFELIVAALILLLFL